MALTTLTTDLNVIAALDNYPPDDAGMTPAILKAKFDQAPNAIKTYINDTLIPELEAGYIASIERTSGDSSAGSTDTYTITYQDASTGTFTIYNGTDGATGAQGIQGIQGVAGSDGTNGADGADGADGASAYVHIKWGASATPATLLETPAEYIGIVSSASATPPADYTGYTWYLWKGLKGDTGLTGETGATGATGATGSTGTAGNGISSVTLKSGNHTPGTTDTYTITFTDSSTVDFTVYNGADGDGAGDMLKSVYDPTNVNDSPFNADNHSSGTTNKVFTASEQSKLSGIDESANNYVHPTTAGNKHIPSGGSANQVLKYSSDGTAVWGADENTTYAASDFDIKDLTDSTSLRATWSGKAAVGSSTPSTQAYGDAAASGSSAEAARVDHKHAMPATTKDKTAVTGIMKGNGTNVSAATAGTDYQAPTTITVNANESPALGTLANNTEYRCTDTTLTTAPTMTLAAIASTSTEFVCAVIFKAPNATAPVVTNNSGYTLKYQGQDVSAGTWTPVANTFYRVSIVFDGLNVNMYISGVA